MPGAKLAAYGIKFPLMGQSEPDFWKLPGKERMVLIAAYLIDVVKIREQGWNRGPWVERVLRSVGLGVGNPWCAAFVSLCAELAEFPIGPKVGRGAVRNWVKWAQANNLLGFKPTRGDLGYFLNANGKGHIGIILNVADERHVESGEGNTDDGGSREGDGAYRRKRIIGSGWKVIRT